MKAAVVTEQGVQVKDAPKPSPKPNEILIRVKAASLQPPPRARISPTVAWYWAERTCSAARLFASSLRRASSSSSWLTRPLR